MRASPLQLWESGTPPDWVLTYGQATEVASALLGIYIAYHAYRGYRRNESRPMLYVSLGFTLALAVPFVLLLAYLAIPFLSEAGVSLATQTSQVLGLVAILYALRMPG